MAEWISLREFARRMRCSLPAVQKAIATGRVSPSAVRRSGSGRLKAIEAEAAAQQWALRTDPAAAAKNGRYWPAPAIEGEPGAPAPATDADPPCSYRAARTKREQHLASLAELELLQRVGTLVEAVAVDKEITEILTRLKSSVLRIADRKSDILAAETDTRRVHALLVAELTSAFAEASRAFADAAEK